MAKNYSLYILAGALFILGLSLGFFIGKNLQMPKQFQTASTIPGDSASSSNLYTSQTASITGVITKRDGNNLTVKNLNNQSEGQVKASSRLIIAKAGSGPNTASPSSDLSKVEFNKEAFIALELIAGEYQVVSIQYVLPAPSLPPPPKTSVQPSAQTKP